MWHDIEAKIDLLNFNLVAEAAAQLIRDSEGQLLTIDGDRQHALGVPGAESVHQVEREAAVLVAETAFHVEPAQQKRGNFHTSPLSVLEPLHHAVHLLFGANHIVAQLVRGAKLHAEQTDLGDAFDEIDDGNRLFEIGANTQYAVMFEQHSGAR